MKKLILSVVFVFASFAMVNANEAFIENSDYCFERAIEGLEDMESAMGFTFNQQDATDILNDGYMICWCMDNIEFCMENW